LWPPRAATPAAAWPITLPRRPVRSIVARVAAYSYACGAAHGTAASCQADSASYCAFAEGRCGVNATELLQIQNCDTTYSVACTFGTLSSLYCLGLVDCPLAICGWSANGTCLPSMDKAAHMALYSLASSGGSGSAEYGMPLAKLYEGCQALGTQAACAASPTPAVDKQLKGLAVTTISSNANGTNINITTSDGAYTSVTNQDGSSTVTFPNGTYTYYANVITPCSPSWLLGARLLGPCWIMGLLTVDSTRA
jgi:hypothetical protein